MIQKLLPCYGGFISVALISILIVGLSILWLRFKTVKSIEKRLNDYWHKLYADKFELEKKELKIISDQKWYDGFNEGKQYILKEFVDALKNSSNTDQIKIDIIKKHEP